jgi:hypothetical protein
MLSLRHKSPADPINKGGFDDTNRGVTCNL